MQGFKDLWAHERVLNIMEQLVGPEIGGQPSWNLRCKVCFLRDSHYIPACYSGYVGFEQVFRIPKRCSSAVDKIQVGSDAVNLKNHTDHVS